MSSTVTVSFMCVGVGVGVGVLVVRVLCKLNESSKSGNRHCATKCN